MNAIEEFEDATTTNSRPSPPLAGFQNCRSFTNFQQHSLSNNFSGVNYNYQNSPRHVIRSPSNLNPHGIRRSFTSRQLFNHTTSTTICYRPPVPSQIGLPNYHLRGTEFRPQLYAQVPGNYTYQIRQPCPVFRQHAPVYDIRALYQQPTRILQKPTVKPTVSMPTREQSLSSLNPATLTVNIPLASLKAPPASMMVTVDGISKRTNTHIFAFDGGLSQNCNSVLVKYCIYGKWRDCYEAGKLLWKRLSKPYTAYVHESWLTFINFKAPGSNGASMRNLYPNIEIKHLPSTKVLSVSGFYWDVQKLRKELVLRQRKKVTRMSGDLLIVDYASDSGMEEIESIEILSQLKSDIDSSLNSHELVKQNQQFAANFGQSFCKNSVPNIEDNSNGSPNNSISLKATEILKLIFGPDVNLGTSQPPVNITESFENSQEIDEIFSEDDAEQDLELQTECNEIQVNQPSIIFIPGQDIPVFSSELDDEEEGEEVYGYTEPVKSSSNGNETSDYEVIDSALNYEDEGPIDDENDFEQQLSPTTLTAPRTGQQEKMADEYNSGSDNAIPLLIDDIDKLEEIDFPRQLS